MRIGLIGAMLEEISLFKPELNNIETKIIGGRDYHIGNLYGVETVLVYSRCGKVASAATASILITKFDVDCLIFTGVAGALSADVNIGDIVIANQLYQYDLDASPIFPKYQIPLTGKTFLDADKDLVTGLQSAADLFVNNSISKYINKSTLNSFFITKPTIHLGKIASGDLFVNEPLKSASILSDMPDALAVEMEGAAVAQVCSEHNIPFAVLRVISDKANHSAAIDFVKFVSEIACFYSKGIVENLFNASSLGEPWYTRMKVAI